MVVDIGGEHGRRSATRDPRGALVPGFVRLAFEYRVHPVPDLVPIGQSGQIGGGQYVGYGLNPGGRQGPINPILRFKVSAALRAGGSRLFRGGQDCEDREHICVIGQTVGIQERLQIVYAVEEE